ncbi:MAG TPA: protein translocase subunit SecF [Elusimicrobiota bacterium]|nr:protein translocase subunit SecF [Elusimicrobiota bacterium]
MEFFKTPNFDFLKVRHYFYALSGVLAAVSIVSLVMHRGPNFSIDFTGGTLIQGFFANPVPMDEIRQTIASIGLEGADLQSVPEHNAVIIRFKRGDKAKDELSNTILEGLNKRFVDNKFQIERVEFVGPAVGQHLVKQAFWAIILSMLGIVLYVAFRFKNWIWGVSGVLALAHDVFITVGFFSVTNKEVSLTVIAALLTLAGYSINDTIVIFDRIRENLRARRKESLDVLINRSLNETLSRTIITSFTVFTVLLSLLFFGGQVIHDFSLALTFGVVVGSYSTLFIATPMVYDWQTRRDARYRPAVKK